jgi:hypothetical protein
VRTTKEAVELASAQGRELRKSLAAKRADAARSLALLMQVRHSEEPGHGPRD